MIALTTYGLFLYASSPILTARSQTSSPMCQISSAPQSRRFSATTGRSLITPALGRSSSPRAFIFACLALTPRPRTVKLNALFALLIMLFAPCCFRHPCLLPTGWRPSLRPLFCSTYCPPRLYSSLRHILPCLASHQPMIIYVSSDANVTQTCRLLLPTNWLLGLFCVSS